MAVKGQEKIQEAVEWFEENALIIVCVIGGIIWVMKRFNPIYMVLIGAIGLVGWVAYVASEKKKRMEEKGDRIIR